MGGTLTKERPGLRWCQYPPARQALVVPSGVVGVGCGGGGTSLVRGGGLSSTLLGPQVTGHRLVGCLVRAGPRATNRQSCSSVEGPGW
jgi:hypothetical protein